MKKNYISILLTLGLTSVAFGSTTTATNKATASLAASCQISAPDVSFGDYVPTTQSNTSQNITILCTRGSSYTISSKAASNATSFPWALSMPNNPYHAAGVMTNTTDATQKIYYEMYFSWAGYWDEDMNLAPQKYTSTGTGANQVINIPYRLVAGQYAAPGNYTASHTMTITF